MFGRLVLRHPTATPIELKRAPFSKLAANLANKQSIPKKRSALLLPLTFPYVKDFASFVNSIVLVSFQEVSVVWARNLNERALTS